MFSRECSLGNRSGIGGRVTILPDVTIGSHAVVTTGSVVTHDVPEYAIVGGVPAVVTKYRNHIDHDV